MKAKEVLSLLGITRPTLTKYVKTGLVKVDSEVNGQYNYNEESVRALLTNKITAVENTEPKSISDNNQVLVNDILADVLNILYQLAEIGILDSASLQRHAHAVNTYNKLVGKDK